MTSATKENGVIDEISMRDKILLALRQLVENGDISREDILKVMPGSKGRAVTLLPEHTFPISGITVKIRKLGPFTLDAVNSQIREENTPPSPPTKTVNYGDADNPDFRTEVNTADKEYQAKLAEYEKKIEEGSSRRLMNTIIENAVVANVDKEETDAMRKFLIAMGVKEEEINKESDHSIYVKHVCIKSTDDLLGLQKAVLGESIPTEEAVKKQEDSFQGDIPRQAD